MEWKIIDGFTDYRVSENGDVYSTKRNKILRQHKRKNYLGVYLYAKDKRQYRLVHRLVANAFIPNPNNLPQINHKDENSLNNCVDNLEWCTAKYNCNYGTHIEKIRERMKGHKPFKGKKHTEEAKEKMRIAKLGRTLTEDHKKKISASNKGKGRKGNQIYCVELDKIFESAMEVQRQLEIPNPNIIQVCLGKRKTAGGYHWQYVKEL